MGSTKAFDLRQEELSSIEILNPENITNTAEEAINELLVMVATAFILLMQLGFALLENGMVRPKNSKNILIKNLFDTCVGALCFWMVGFGFAFSEKENDSFLRMDGDMFVSSGFSKAETNLYLLWIF